MEENPFLSGLEEKKNAILAHEMRFAEMLAVSVLDKPQLSIWMILIPIIFVYYFYQLQKFSAGKKTFSEHFLVSRKRALEEAFASVSNGREPDMDALMSFVAMPEEVRPFQTEVLSALVTHYISLLRQEGEDYATLVRSAYRSRTNFLLFLNALTRAERRVNEALAPHLEKTQEGVRSAIGKIESFAESLRRHLAEEIFP